MPPTRDDADTVVEGASACPLWSFHDEAGARLIDRPRWRERRIVISVYSHFAAHCSVTAKAQDKFTRHQNVERYRRLLKTATDEERRNYLGRLIVEELQKQKDAGDSDYQY
jgi:hypothetical protein